MDNVIGGSNYKPVIFNAKGAGEVRTSTGPASALNEPGDGVMNDTQVRPAVRIKPTIYPGDGDHRHGTENGYNNLGCRCEDCRIAWSEYQRGRRG